MGTWYKRLLSYGVVRAECYAYLAYLAHEVSSISRMSNLNIYRSLIVLLLGPYT